MKLYIKTYGCQMNVYDSERMADVLAPLGFTSVDDADGADMVILNTCHIREKAAEKVYSELGRLGRLKERRKKEGSRLILAVAGCVAQAEGAEIRTVEGLADGKELHPVQIAFLKEAALQCGVCTPGFLVAATDLLERNPNPTEHEIRYWLAGNLCRCTGYQKILEAVQSAATELRATGK